MPEAGSGVNRPVAMGRPLLVWFRVSTHTPWAIFKVMASCNWLTWLCFSFAFCYGLLLIVFPRPAKFYACNYKTQLTGTLPLDPLGDLLSQAPCGIALPRVLPISRNALGSRTSPSRHRWLVGSWSIWRRLILTRRLSELRRHLIVLCDERQRRPRRSATAAAGDDSISASTQYTWRIGKSSPILAWMSSPPSATP